MNKTRLTITLDSSVADKLPSLNKSAIINQILKSYYMSQQVTDIANAVAEILLNDKNFTARITKTRFQLTQYQGRPQVIDLQKNEMFEIGEK